MRTGNARFVPVGLASALVLFGVSHPAGLAGQASQPRASSPSAPAYLGWPLPASGAQYAGIDGKHLWQYVQDQADIARRYRDQGHPQFWGRIAGTSGDVEAADWLLAKFRQIGLSDTRVQPVAFFHPQWAPTSWEVTVTAGGNTITLWIRLPFFAVNEKCSGGGRSSCPRRSRLNAVSCAGVPLASIRTISWGFVLDP